MHVFQYIWEILRSVSSNVIFCPVFSLLVGRLLVPNHKCCSGLCYTGCRYYTGAGILCHFTGRGVGFTSYPGLHLSCLIYYKQIGKTDHNNWFCLLLKYRAKLADNLECANTVDTTCLCIFKCKLIKIKYKFNFLSHSSHISSAQWLRAAGGCHIARNW